jgi:hypothetical protein
VTNFYDLIKSFFKCRCGLPIKKYIFLNQYFSYTDDDNSSMGQQHSPQPEAHLNSPHTPPPSFRVDTALARRARKMPGHKEEEEEEEKEEEGDELPWGDNPDEKDQQKEEEKNEERKEEKNEEKEVAVEPENAIEAKAEDDNWSNGEKAWNRKEFV